MTEMRLTADDFPGKKRSEPINTDELMSEIGRKCELLFNNDELEQVKAGNSGKIGIYGMNRHTLEIARIAIVDTDIDCLDFKTAEPWERVYCQTFGDRRYGGTVN